MTREERVHDLLSRHAPGMAGLESATTANWSEVRAFDAELDLDRVRERAFRAAALREFEMVRAGELEPTFHTSDGETIRRYESLDTVEEAGFYEWPPARFDALGHLGTPDPADPLQRAYVREFVAAFPDLFERIDALVASLDAPPNDTAPDDPATSQGSESRASDSTGDEQSRADVAPHSSRGHGIPDLPMPDSFHRVTELFDHALLEAIARGDRTRVDRILEFGDRYLSGRARSLGVFDGLLSAKSHWEQSRRYRWAVLAVPAAERVSHVERARQKSLDPDGFRDHLRDEFVRWFVPVCVAIERGEAGELFESEIYDSRVAAEELANNPAAFDADATVRAMAAQVELMCELDVRALPANLPVVSGLGLPTDESEYGIFEDPGAAAEPYRGMDNSVGRGSVRSSIGGQQLLVRRWAASLRASEFELLAMSLEAYALEHGALPPTVETLVDAGFLARDQLRDAERWGFDYDPSAGTLSAAGDPERLGIAPDLSTVLRRD